MLHIYLMTFTALSAILLAAFGLTWWLIGTIDSQPDLAQLGRRLAAALKTGGLVAFAVFWLLVAGEVE